MILSFVDHMLHLTAAEETHMPLPMHVSSVLFSCLIADIVLPLEATLGLLEWLARQPEPLDVFVVSNALMAAAGIHRGNAEALQALHPVLVAILAKSAPVKEPVAAYQLLLADALYMQAMLPAEEAALMVKGEKTAPAGRGLLLDYPDFREHCIQTSACGRMANTISGCSIFHEDVKSVLANLDVTKIESHRPLLPMALWTDLLCTLDDGSKLAVMLTRECLCFVNAPDVVDGRMLVQRDVLHTAGIPVVVVDKLSWDSIRDPVDKNKKRFDLITSRIPVLRVPKHVE